MPIRIEAITNAPKVDTDYLITSDIARMGDYSRQYVHTLIQNGVLVPEFRVLTLKKGEYSARDNAFDKAIILEWIESRKC